MSVGSEFHAATRKERRPTVVSRNVGRHADEVTQSVVLRDDR